jgi:hypothetical protein
MSQEDPDKPLYRVVRGMKIYNSYPKQAAPPSEEDKIDLQLLAERFDRFENILKSLVKYWQKMEREEILDHELASYLDYLYS